MFKSGTVILLFFNISFLTPILNDYYSTLTYIDILSHNDLLSQKVHEINGLSIMNVYNRNELHYFHLDMVLDQQFELILFSIH